MSSFDEHHRHRVKVQFQANRTAFLRRLVMAAGGMVVMLVLVLLFTPLAGVGPTLIHRLQLGLGVVFMIPLVFAKWRYWRCPACGHGLGKNISPTSCRHCGIPLDDDPRG